MISSFFTGVNVKTGEIFPANFTDKGPERPLRIARQLTGGQQVSCNKIFHFIFAPTPPHENQTSIANAFFILHCPQLML